MSRYTTGLYPIQNAELYEPAETAFPIELAADELGGLAASDLAQPLNGNWDAIVGAARAETQRAFEVMQAAAPITGAPVRLSDMVVFNEAKTYYEKHKARMNHLQALSVWSSLPVAP